jgi:hypothetical protein
MGFLHLTVFFAWEFAQNRSRFWTSWRAVALKTHFLTTFRTSPVPAAGMITSAQKVSLAHEAVNV